MRIFSRALLPVVAFLVAASLLNEAVAAEPAGALPLTKGTSWTYKGTVRWSKAGQKEPQIKEVEWTMKVLEVMEKNHVRAALVEGHPLDLAHYREGRKPSNYVVICAGSGKYYLIAQPRATKVWEQMKKSDPLLRGIVKEGELFLDLPLTVGEVFGGAGDITRQDHVNHWKVASEQDLKPGKIPGITGGGKQYELLLRTHPDEERVLFLPGVGFTEYEYSHNGTPSDLRLKLVQFHKG